jgi:hypothetical protein
MGRQKEYKQINIDVEPFLSIMAIVLKLISLILVVIVMRIAVNTKLVKAIALQGLWTSHRGDDSHKAPSYIDCYPDKVVLYYSGMTGSTGVAVDWQELQRPDNAVEKLLQKVQDKADEEYVVVMARPNSVKFYRTVRSLISKRPIDVGYDAVDADFEVHWDAARKALGISE